MKQIEVLVIPVAMYYELVFRRCLLMLREVDAACVPTCSDLLQCWILVF
jgi:hypothetical protein